MVSQSRYAAVFAAAWRADHLAQNSGGDFDFAVDGVGVYRFEWLLHDACNDTLLTDCAYLPVDFRAALSCVL